MFESSSTSCWRRWTVNLAYFIFNLPFLRPTSQSLTLFWLARFWKTAEGSLYHSFLKQCNKFDCSSSAGQLWAIGVELYLRLWFHWLWTNPSAAPVDEEVHRGGRCWGLDSTRHGLFLHKFMSSYETAYSQVGRYVSQKVRKQNRSPSSWLAYCWWVFFNH